MAERWTARKLLVTLLEMLGVALLVFALAWGLVRLAGRAEASSRGATPAPRAAPTAS